MTTTHDFPFMSSIQRAIAARLTFLRPGCLYRFGRRNVSRSPLRIAWFMPHVQRVDLRRLLRSPRQPLPQRDTTRILDNSYGTHHATSMRKIGIMWNWLINDVMNNPSAWAGVAIAAVVALVGWAGTGITWIVQTVSNRRKTKREKTERDKALQEERDRFNQQIDTLKAQLQAERDSAEALRKHVQLLEESNRIARAANPPDKAPWGDAEWTGSGELFRIRHEGKRNAVVTGLRASEENLAGLAHFDQQPPFMCEPGDSITYLAIGTQAGRPSTLIEWHWEDSDEPRETTRHNIKS